MPNVVNNYYWTTDSGYYDNIWINWAQQITSTTTVYGSYTDSIWTGWITNWTGSTDRLVQADTLLTEQWRVAQEQSRAASRDYHARITAANDRAGKLLESCLSEEQRKILEVLGHFEIETRAGNIYRIKKGIAGNIERIVHGVPVERLCCHPDPNLPVPDVMLAQKIDLLCDEETFRRTANITPLHLNHRETLRPILAAAA